MEIPVHTDKGRMFCDMTKKFYDTNGILPRYLKITVDIMMIYAGNADFKIKFG